jgi:small basic protein
MSNILRGKLLPLAVASFAAAIMFGDFFVDYKPVSNASQTLLSWTLVTSGFAILVGYVVLLRHHFREMMKTDKTSTSYLSGIAIAASLIYMGIGLVLGIKSPLYDALYLSIPGAVSMALWSLLGMFMLAGAYRAFIARNMEGVVFLCATVLLMIYRAPISAVIWPGFGIISEWLIETIQRGATRGLVICSALGATIIALRALLGEEQGFFKRA